MTAPETTPAETDAALQQFASESVSASIAELEERFSDAIRRFNRASIGGFSTRRIKEALIEMNAAHTALQEARNVR